MNQPCLPLCAATLAAAVLFACSLSAQDPGLALAGPGTAPIRSGPIAPDGTTAGTWASGADYKVRFDGGMTFYPYVGPDLSHQPVHWRTVSVRAGDHELRVAPPAQALARCSATRCEYDLGAVVERYDVRAHGLEQSFVVAARPPAGDLVIRGELTTPLTMPERAAAHAPVELCLPGGERVVRYGAAIAIDATGAATPMTTAVAANTIELRLPAAAVAAARFPLVVDPLIANVTLRQGATIVDVDVMHEDRTASGLQGRSWVAVSRTVAANDDDVRLLRFGSAFGGLAEVYREISLWSSTHPRLAFAGTTDDAVLVHSTDIGTNRFVFVHRHHISDLTLTTTLDVVPGTLAESHWRPDVGGRVAPDGSRVLIVYQREDVAPFANTATSEVWATVYDTASPGSPFAVAPFRVRTLSNRDQERPVVNQEQGAGEWLVAFQEHNGNVANDDWDVEVQSVSAAGVVGATTLSTEDAGTVALHKVGPQLAGAGGRYLLTYATRDFEQTNPKPTLPEGTVLRAQRIDWDHTADVGSRPHAAVDLFTAPSVAARTEGLAYDRTSDSHWCAGSRHDGTTSYRVHKLGFDGNVVETGTLPLAAQATPAALAIAWNGVGRMFPVVFAENDGSAATNKVVGTQMQYDPVSPPATLGFACGSGVWGDLAAIAAKQQVGAEGMPLALVGAPADTVALLFVSTANVPIPGDLFGAPGCTLQPDLLAPSYLGSLAFGIVGGGAATTLDLPANLAPVTLVMQWVYFVPGANPLGFLASEGLSVQVAR